MRRTLEAEKISRTGLLPALLGGGFLAALLPVVNLAFRSGTLITSERTALQTLAGSNWSLMAMVNSILIILAACILYHVEFSEKGIRRMDSLPVRPSNLYMNKFLLLAVCLAAVLVIEAGGFIFCAWEWYDLPDGILTELWKFFVAAYLLELPMLAGMLALSSICENMWLTLGVGVIGVFTAQLLYGTHILRWFPFLLPYQAEAALDIGLCLTTVLETVLFIGIGMCLPGIRRNRA